MFHNAQLQPPIARFLDGVEEFRELVPGTAVPSSVEDDYGLVFGDGGAFLEGVLGGLEVFEFADVGGSVADFEELVFFFCFVLR
mmetsp:Transcript_29783/g.62715  ORF Transcript_29783/g.62715 Transcript_29783/m.62715 type:complete len:84 (-) Transcript_29783:3039-3290(-)